jgi:hypothetical protein
MTEQTGARYGFLDEFLALGHHVKHRNTQARYILDSFPVAVCDNGRRARCRLGHGDAYRGLPSL